MNGEIDPARLRDEAFVNSLVGEGARFRGDIELQGLLRIDGDFSGSVKTMGKVFVGKQGRAECSLSAAAVVIGGMFKGTIEASDRVVILSSAMVIGRIACPRILVEEGVVIDGYISVSASHAEKRQTGRTGAKPAPRLGFLRFGRRPAEVTPADATATPLRTK